MKKTIIAVTSLLLSMSVSMAISKDTPKTHTQNKAQHNKIADIYASADEKADIAGKITLKNQDNYNIFYCKQDNWCEVVNTQDGQTGWVNLEQLKNAQQKQAQYQHKNATIDNMVKYIQLQDQKIIQLQTAMMQMQKQFANALQQQQIQINQLKQAYYY